MARKGKEVSIGGLRIQIDPLVLLTRVLMHQKILLGIIAFLGGLATIAVYYYTPKRYASRANILIRYENFDDLYLQKLLNVGVGYLGADLEMMLIINELDLYTATRKKLPYEMALREIRKDLTVKNQPRNIEISYMSKDPMLAQRVAAFVTERLMGKMADLTEAPFNREMDALDVAISDLEPKKRAAETKLFEFGGAHPEIANRLGDLMAMGGSPLVGLESDIRRAEADLAAAQTGKVVAQEARAPRDTPETQKLRELEQELLKARGRLTDANPEVMRLQRAVSDQKKKVIEEQASLDGEVLPGQNVEDARKGRIARAQARLKELIEQKVELEKASIKRPELQREFAELSLSASTFNSELRDLLTRRETIRRDRVVSMNRFQENFQLVDAAKVPEIPAEPSRNQIMIVGMALTALIGLAIAAVREAFRQTFLDATEFEEQTGLQVFAVLPNIKKEGA
ncbi:MAG: hypothetical protein U1E65_06335 [Myxococcota bacterium]